MTTKKRNYPKKRKSRLVKDYALYRAEELLMVGTISELATFLNKKEKTVLTISYPSYHKRFKENNNRLYALPLED